MKCFPSIYNQNSNVKIKSILKNKEDINHVNDILNDHNLSNYDLNIFVNEKHNLLNKLKKFCYNNIEWINFEKVIYLENEKYRTEILGYMDDYYIKILINHIYKKIKINVSLKLENFII